MNIKDFAQIIVYADKNQLKSREFISALWTQLYRDKSLNKLEAIIRLAQAIKDKEEKQMNVTIRSATPLSDLQIEDVKHALTQQFKKETIINYNIDSSLGAGIIITSGDWILDASLRGKIEQLGRTLKEHNEI